jgi:hypothetical protein
MRNEELELIQIMYLQIQARKSHSIDLRMVYDARGLELAVRCSLAEDRRDSCAIHRSMPKI